MTLEAIRVPTAWRGPAESGNGGYTCGLVAHAMGVVAAEVTLRSPPPLERDLAVEPRGEGVSVRDGETLVAEGEPATVELEIPEAPSPERAAEAACAGYEDWARQHPFPECVVCGPEREPGDGLRIFPGELGETGLFACAWAPDALVGDDDGTVRPECVWAALDCPSAAPARLEPGGPPAVLGRLSASFDAPVRVGEPHVILSWALERSGRKSTNAAALFDSRGRVLGRARAVWIELKA
jgi:hypothetical protein